jgi:arginine/lysine/ornithine decarboxylase
MTRCAIWPLCTNFLGPQTTVHALEAWREAAESLDPPPAIELPSPEELQLKTVMLPRDAFFGPTELVSAAEAVGRIAAEQITPYPPGIPAVIPGELLDDAVIDYLRSGAEAGMVLPEPADAQLEQIRVVTTG